MVTARRYPGRGSGDDLLRLHALLGGGFGELRLMIYGLALTLVVLFMPGGIVQAWNSITRR